MFSAKTGIFGLEIGAQILRVASIRKGFFGYAIQSVNELAISKSPLLKNGLGDKKEFGEQVHNLLAQSQPRPIAQTDCAVSLPESSVFSKVITVPKVSRKELVQSIPFEAAEFLPLPLEEMYVDWQVDTEANTGDAKTLHVLVVAVSKRLVDELHEVLQEQGLKMLYLESQPFSLVRCLHPYLTPKKVTMLIHINRELTTMILANANAIKFTATIPMGVAELQADKKHYTALADELKENINYYHNRLEEKAPIERLVLTGTGALTPGLSDFLAKETNLTCEVGYPVITLPGKEPIHPRFGTVLGAAMRKKEQ